MIVPHQAWFSVSQFACNIGGPAASLHSIPAEAGWGAVCSLGPNMPNNATARAKLDLCLAVHPPN